MTLADRLIAVTGANGFLGMHIVKLLLEKGVKTRAIVRSTRAKGAITKALGEHTGTGLLTFAIVPDILGGDEVYHTAFEGASAIIHTASPIFEFGGLVEDPEKDFYQPAETGALNAIRAASKQSSVDRFVYTGSIVTSLPSQGYGEILRSYQNPIKREEAQSLHQAQDAYRVSKAFSERALWRFVETENPSLKVTVILPSLIAGPPVDADAPYTTGSNSLYMSWAQNPTPFLKGGMTMPSIDVRDCAQAHVNAALRDEGDDRVNGKRLFISERTISIAEAADIARQEAPKLAAGWTQDVTDQIVAALGRKQSELSDRERGYSIPEAATDAKALGVFPLRSITETLSEMYKLAAESV